MDAHSKSATRRAASSAIKSNGYATRLVLSAAMHAALLAQFGGYTLEQLEQDCRLLMRRTAAAAIELGKRLMMIKELVDHGQWLPTVERIGINSRQAARFMRAAIRFGNLGDCPALVKAADSPAKLIELLALDDEDLQAIEAGDVRHGISVSTLPAMTVKQLRAALHKNAPESAAASLPPSASPILGIEPATKAKSNSDLNGNDSEQYPAVYTLLPGDFDGRPFGIVRYNGHIWLIAEEVAALIGMTPEATREMLAMIDGDLVNEFPTDSIAKVRMASTPTVLRLLNARAIKKLWLVSESSEAEALVQWIEGEESPPNQPAAPTPIASAKPMPTVHESLDALRDVHYDVLNKWFQLEGQAKAISQIASANDRRSEEVSLLGTLADTALMLLVEMDGMLDRHDQVQDDLRARLLTSTGPGEQLPESVWLDLVTELADAHEGGFTSEGMGNLASIVDTMTHYGEDSPEVTAAWQIVQAYADRNGAVLFDHWHAGETQESGRVAFRWKEGMRPNLRQKAQETAPAH